MGSTIDYDFVSDGLCLTESRIITWGSNLNNQTNIFKFLTKLIPLKYKIQIKNWLQNQIEGLAKSLLNGFSKRTEDLETALTQLQSVLKAELIPLPPPKHLQLRVIGVYTPGFIESGFATYNTLAGVLKSQGKDIENFKAIYDFGCGCGRVIRAFRYYLPTCDLYGTDIDAEAIEWLQNNNTRIAEFSVNPNIPPTLFEDNKFDFIYSISIFTHLPENMQFAWLEELKRISKPGGYLLVTVHGENHHKNLPVPKREIVEAKGFYYNDDADLTDGLPAFYKNAYHSANYIKKEWGMYFDVIKIIPMGLDNHQDIVILRKQA